MTMLSWPATARQRPRCGPLRWRGWTQMERTGSSSQHLRKNVTYKVTLCLRLSLPSGSQEWGPWGGPWGGGGGGGGGAAGFPAPFLPAAAAVIVDAVASQCRMLARGRCRRLRSMGKGKPNAVTGFVGGSAARHPRFGLLAVSVCASLLSLSSSPSLAHQQRWAFPFLHPNQNRAGTTPEVRTGVPPPLRFGMTSADE